MRLILDVVVVEPCPIGDRRVPAQPAGIGRTGQPDGHPVVPHRSAGKPRWKRSASTRPAASRGTGADQPRNHRTGPPATPPATRAARNRTGGDLHRSGIAVPFGPDRRSVLELAEACDVPTRWSCRTGICHTCSTALLSGDVAYDPSPLEPPAEGQVLVCCAQPGTDIVLDM